MTSTRIYSTLFLFAVALTAVFVDKSVEYTDWKLWVALALSPSPILICMYEVWRDVKRSRPRCARPPRPTEEP